MYYVTGIEAFNYAEVYGVHRSRKIAQQQADALQKNQNALSCQRITVLTGTQTKRYKLYA